MKPDWNLNERPFGLEFVGMVLRCSSGFKDPCVLSGRGRERERVSNGSVR